MIQQQIKDLILKKDYNKKKNKIEYYIIKIIKKFLKNQHELLSRFNKKFSSTTN